MNGRISFPTNHCFSEVLGLFLCRFGTGDSDNFNIMNSGWRGIVVTNFIRQLFMNAFWIICVYISVIFQNTYKIERENKSVYTVIYIVVTLWFGGNNTVCNVYEIGMWVEKFC